MHIEIWQSPPRIGDQRWHWHIVSKGRKVADAESFPSKANALRAAKAVVRGIIKRIHDDETGFHPDPPRFILKPTDTQRFKLTWY